MGKISFNWYSIEYKLMSKTALMQEGYNSISLHTAASTPTWMFVQVGPMAQVIFLRAEQAFRAGGGDEYRENQCSVSAL